MEALRHFDSIAGAADAIILSRGNLGLDVAPEKTAVVQKAAINRCNLLVLVPLLCSCFQCEVLPTCGLRASPITEYRYVVCCACACLCWEDSICCIHKGLAFSPSSLLIGC